MSRVSSSRARRVARSNTSRGGIPVLVLLRRLNIPPAITAMTTKVTIIAVDISADSMNRYPQSLGDFGGDVVLDPELIADGPVICLGPCDITITGANEAGGNT